MNTVDLFGKNQDSGGSTCNSPMYPFLIICGLLLILRMIITIFVWIAWFQNRNRLRSFRKENPSLSALPVEKRIPFIPIVSTTAFITLFTIFILLSLNVLNQKVNGGITVFLLHLWLYQICIIQGFTLRKVISLGSKIFIFRSSPMNPQQGNAFLSKFDCNLRIVTLLMLVLFSLSIIFIFVEIIVTDHETSLIFIRAALISLTLEQFFLYGSMIYQYERCVRYLKRIIQDDDKEMMKSMKKMRYQQIVMLITGLGHCGLLTYWASSLSFSWWIILLCCFFDCFVYGMMVISLLTCRRKKSDAKTRLVHNNEDNNNLTTDILSTGNQQQ